MISPKFSFIPLLITVATAATSDDDGFKTGSNNTVGAGTRSIAAGWNNTPYLGSVAIGLDNTTHGYSLGVGEDNIVSNILNDQAWNSIVAGSQNEIHKGVSVALFGHANSVDGSENGSMFAGRENQSIYPSAKGGQGNILLGIGNQISGDPSEAPSSIEGNVLLGVDNVSSVSYGWAIGRGNIAQSSTVTVGEFADPVSNSSLIVGNGTAGNQRSNSFTVMKDGTVNIPSGNLVLGSVPALTAVSAASVIDGRLETGGYLKRVAGTGAAAATGALIAYGPGAGALGINSIALGEDALATADGSIAIGKGSLVGEFGWDSVALSGGAANAPYSMGAGGGQAYGTFALAMMMGMASSEFSIAIGGYDTSVNNYPANVSLGEGSTTIGGVANVAEGFSSFSSGFWTRAKSANSIALGSLNRGDSTSSTAWVETDPLFELGNGNAPRSAEEPASGNRSNALTTLKNGRTTLENKFWQPSQPLADPQEADDKDSGGEALVVKGHTKLMGKVIIAEPQGDILLGVFGEGSSAE